MQKQHEAKAAQGVDLQKKQEKGMVKILPKAALNLDETVKVLDKLWMMQRQRVTLNHTIDNLNDFEIKRKESEIDENSNHWTGCELVLKDDERRSFSTKNPVLITAVVEFLKDRCTHRLMEVEAEIVLPGY